MPSNSSEDSFACSAEEIAEHLREKLATLSYLAFATCVSVALPGLGYSSIGLSERIHLKGRTRSGGFDFTARTQTPLGRASVAGQLKRYNRVAVSRRYVDEQRGTNMRLAFPQGLIVTSGRFSKPARKSAAADPSHPIRLVDGAELSRLMVEQHIGCASTVHLLTGERRYRLADEQFAELEYWCARIVAEHSNS